MRLPVLFLLFAMFLAPAAQSQSGAIELMNGNLIAKLHLDETPRNGQMVGAYIVSIRPNSNTPVNKVTVLLNPGLQFVKADAGRQRLTAQSSISAVQGMDTLELNVIEINLPTTLSAANRNSGKDRIDIAIHYRGYLEDLSWTGLTGVKDTLSPHFTMVRAESFAYPVFAEASIASIRKALNHKSFPQAASIEYSGAGTAVSNLTVESKNIAGNKTSADLSTENSAQLMSVAIGAFSVTSNNTVSVAYLDGNQQGAARVSNLFAAEANSLKEMLGPVSGATIKIVEMPDGFVSNAPSELIFVNRDFMNAPTITSAHKSRIFGLWKLNKSGREGHWGGGLDAVISTAVTAPDMMSEVQMMQFSAAKQLFNANKKMGATALADYAVDGFSAQSDQVSQLAFAVLYDLLGRDDFFAFTRGLRAEFSSGYRDMEAVAAYLQKNLKNKKAKKFAKNWFSSGKAGKDMAKAKSFAELKARYK